MRDNLRKMQQMEKEERYMLMENFTKETLRMINAVAMVFTRILMVADMRENGKKISNMGKVRKSGTMELRPTKEISLWERSMAKVNSPGLMVQFTKENSRTMI